MKRSTSYTFVTAIALWAGLQLGACSSTDRTGPDQIMEQPQTMGRKGGGGMRGGGGPPGGREDMTAKKEKSIKLSDEAFTICRTKKDGDIVEVKDVNGELRKATCTLIDDHLVAMVEIQDRPNNHKR